MYKDIGDILIVDDDKRMRVLLHTILSSDGYLVRQASCGFEALRLIHAQLPGLVVLDINMADMDGITVLKNIRSFSDMPVIMVTARNNTEDKMQLLDLGADDYVSKPFVTGELLARIRAVLRRTNTKKQPSELSIYDDGYLKVLFDTREVFAAGNQKMLTKLEFDLLHELVSDTNKVHEYDLLIEIFWGKEHIGAKDALQHVINSLRKKVEPDTQHPRYIINIPGVGYRYYPHVG